MSLTVALYFLYPVLISQIATMSNCAEYDFGDGQPPRKLLKLDISVSCSSDRYMQVCVGVGVNQVRPVSTACQSAPEVCDGNPPR